MIKETGGPAFPAPNYICDSARIDKDAFQRMGLTQGMTLRDWFAGQALIALHDPTEEWFQKKDPTGQAMLRALWAYGQADAMLTARKDSDEAK